MVTAQWPLHVGVMGAQSTGKTQLLDRIEKELTAQGTIVVRTGGFGERAALMSLPEMQRHTSAATEWAIAQGIADEIAAAARPGREPAQVVLADRTAWDALAFYYAAQEWHHNRAHRLERERLRLLASTQAPKYSLLFATVLDPAIPIRPEHPCDPRFRSLVDQYAHRILTEEGLPHLRVTSEAHSQDRAVEHALSLCLLEAPV